MRRRAGSLALVASLLAVPVAAQNPEPETRTALIEQEQVEKSTQLHPFEPGKVERYLDWAETLLGAGEAWHPFFNNAYSGGGFTVGAGYNKFVSPYNTIDARGSITVSGYKRLEVEFIAPNLFKRQGMLSVIGGWREATQVGFYGFGTSNTVDDRANYGFKQPYGQAMLNLRPGRRNLLIRAGFEFTEWNQTPGSGTAPSVDEVYTPAALPGLGASVTYLHPQATVAFDSREAAGYARRGGFYGVTVHDFADRDNKYGFTQLDYEAVQHVPILREAWVLSFHGLVSTTGTKGGEVIPFFMLPSVGGGSSLRGFSSWRFRDRNSLLLQAEWRIMVNRFIDTAVFYDTGKVTAHTSDLSLDHLKNDYGIGIRLHGPLATPLRIDFAKSNEGFSIVWSASAVF
jgi:hypothetical protein